MTAIVDYFIQAGFFLEKRILDPALAPVQQSVVAFFEKNYPVATASTFKWFADNQSVHAKNLPLMNFMHVLALSVFYLSVVFGGKFVMANFVKTKFTLKTFSQIHNAFLVFVSGYMAFNILYQAWYVRGYDWFENPKDEAPAAFTLSKHIWLFYFSKTFEFVDTFIMVAKMNFRQISFLHVYHHLSVFSVWWFTTLIAPGGEVLNSGIHVIMYSYYLLASMGVARPLLNIVKPFITQSQMIQFTIMMFQATWNFVDTVFLTPKEDQHKKYPIFLTVLLWVYMWTMLGLFANFYINSYSKAKKPVAAKEAAGQDAAFPAYTKVSKEE